MGITISNSWKQCAAQFPDRLKAARLADLENQVLNLARAIAGDKSTVTLFGQSRNVSRLNIQSINSVLRKEGSELRFFKWERQVIFGRISKETVSADGETYYFAENELFSNSHPNIAATALHSGIIAIRQRKIAETLTFLASLASLVDVVKPTSVHLNIIKEFLNTYGIMSPQDIENCKKAFIEDVQELELIHEKGHLNRQAEGVFAHQPSFHCIQVIDEILSDLDVLEYVIKTKDKAQINKLFHNLLAQGLTCFAGGIGTHDEVNENRYAFQSAVLLHYFNAKEFQDDFELEINKIRSKLQNLIKSLTRKIIIPSPKAILKIAPKLEVSVRSIPFGDQVTLLLIEPKSMPELLKTEAVELSPIRLERPAILSREEMVANQALARVEKLKSELKKSSFLDLIPGKYRQWVIDLADEAYPTKGNGKSLEEFRDTMALHWLAKNETFEMMAKAEGFKFITNGDTVPPGIDSAILVLTMSGSLIGLSKPDEVTLKRQVFYERIKLRVETDIKAMGEATIPRGIRTGEGVHLSGYFNSSYVIAIATHPQADAINLKGAVMSMTRAFNTLGERVWKIRNPK